MADLRLEPGDLIELGAHRLRFGRSGEAPRELGAALYAQATAAATSGAASAGVRARFFS